MGDKPCKKNQIDVLFEQWLVGRLTLTSWPLYHDTIQCEWYECNKYSKTWSARPRAKKKIPISDQDQTHSNQQNDL